MVKHFDTAFPQKMVNIREKTRGKGWITKGIRTSCQKKRELHIMCKENNATEEMHTHYKTYTKILQKVIKQAKRIYNDYYINNSTNKVKAMWDIIKKETGKNKRTEENIVLIHNNKKILQPTETANIFNKYFTGIAENLIKTNFSSTQHQVVNKCNSNEFSMFMDQVSREETLRAVRELKTTYSAGIDESGIFPDQLKTSKVIPIFKAGDKDEVINYCPITLTSCFSKVIEKIMCSKLLKFININSVPSNTQHGFRSKKSTETAIYECISTVLKTIDEKQQTTGSLTLHFSRLKPVIGSDIRYHATLFPYVGLATAKTDKKTIYEVLLYDDLMMAYTHNM
ncbi:uncharacterized protein LOC124803333 [Schistocerca piceifrons]|uniref:uncharacterized protein LOC124803333 n=1 Tax=Schistocerca piceifrons TaxID=274613 RepID=UPI001F5F61C5|nr:uncharacterized protein LOC124803333 [Schistocerca piceifrons]